MICVCFKHVRSTLTGPPAAVGRVVAGTDLMLEYREPLRAVEER